MENQSILKSSSAAPHFTSSDIIVVGAGIVGLAIAYHAAKQGKSVQVFERNQWAVGASVRNFGLIWPIGQTAGSLLERAKRSQATWRELSTEVGFGLQENGSLHLAYHADEQAVIEEFLNQSDKGYQCQWLSQEEIRKKSPAAKMDGLLGGLFSTTECTVDPREAIRKLPRYLSDTYGVQFHFGSAVQSVEGNTLRVGEKKYRADHIYVCSGADFETLFPEEFQQVPITKCKLQMLRTVPQPKGWQLRATLCGGLTLRHYASFADCPSLPDLDRRFDEEQPLFKEWGIHVMITQNHFGELVIGDSHEYGLTHDPFDREDVDQLILDYLSTFAEVPDLKITQRWHGIYPKLPGATELVLQPTDEVTIVNALGGAGMTLSFGLAEELLTNELE
ncbi:TIGR03364 family FAD-dependent oxidoreductase [Tunicatimonas pelagia]|uniref:TIGR03364 family FAD-dependent oxidoreductase n=1 Tax=Tunicatimonas pelagia TaxID=931531 RepID=UPI002665A1B8|nr:TIGR03364 family FAD-dependent oxidoreductase [Tunicatimonas pelagia]WKN43408.1 TIGR03364 family FAD-dependent oxidoreductase [Tunicatimonas pelagia]